MNLRRRVFASAMLLAVAALPGCATVDSWLAGLDTATRPAATATAAPAISAKALVGNSEEQVVALLGRPAAIRDEPPAIVWRYTADAACRIDLFFYFDVASEAFRSLAYKFYPDPRRRPSLGECLAALRAGHQTVQKKKN